MAKLDEDGKEIRRTKGDGGLFQRADGMWIGRIELPPGPNGERRRKQVANRDFAVASKALRKLRTDVDEGRIAVTGNTTITKWLQRWVTEIRGPHLRPGTRDDYESVINNHITPAIGKIRLDKLTPQHVRTMHTKIGPSRTAELAHVILQRALKDAVREGMVNRNVAELVDKPKYTRQKRTSLSVGVAQNVIQTAFASRDESTAVRVAAAFLTGARRGELLGLRWVDVDLDHGTIDFSWQLQQLTQSHGCTEPCGRVKAAYCPQRQWKLPPGFEYEICRGSLLWTRPKTAAGVRRVPVIAPLLAKLRDLHDSDAGNPRDLVWHRDGNPIDPRADYTMWQDLFTDAGLITEGETLPPHVARHTTATLLRAAGVDEQTRMEIIGHATVDSQRVYAHADSARHLGAMSNLTELMG